MIRTRALVASVIAALLTACGGGGGGSAVPAPASSPTAAGQGKIVASVFVPPHTKQAASLQQYLRRQQDRKGRVRSQYLSGATTEIDFTLETTNGHAASAQDQAAFDFTIYTSNSSNCTGDNVSGYTCSLTAPAPAGSDTYSVKSYQCSVSGTSSTTSCASLGGTLTTLSMSYVTIPVQLNQTTTAAFTLSPVVASIDWAPVTYATVTGPSPMQSGLWLTQPNGSSLPTYHPTASPTYYSCATNVGSGTGNGCYEPAAQGTSIAYGEVLEARDANGALIIGASGGAVYQTPLYLDSSGKPITISWSCTDAAGGTSLTFETGGGPFSSNANATQANQAFNSPIVNPASDPDGGNTVDGTGAPVTAIGNNGIEMSWDGADQPLLDSPDSCTASTSNGLTTPANFYVGLGSGGINVNPGTLPDGNIYALGETASVNNSPNVQVLDEYTSGSFTTPSQTLSNVPMGAAAPVSMTLDNSHNLWYSDYNGDLWGYSGLPSSGASPTTAVTLPNIFASFAFDQSGNLYIPNGAHNGYSSIDVYSPGFTSSSTPVRSISGSSTEIDFTPQNIVAIDASGNLWVASGSFTKANYPLLKEFSAGANGNVAPITTSMSLQWFTNCQIPVNSTPLGGASGFFVHALTFDKNGNLLVEGVDTASSTSHQIVIVLPAGFNSQTCPTSWFYAPGTSGAIGQGGLAVDDHGYVYISYVNASSQVVLGIFPENTTNGSSGTGTPYAEFPLHNGGLNSNYGLAVWTSSGYYSP